MHPIVNHLIQLQELSLIRAEQKAHKHDERLQPLDAAIQALTGQLPEDVRVMMLRLQKKDPIVIVPVSNGVCAACGLRLPTSLAQAVRAGGEVHHCPICTRILYYPEFPVRRTASTPRRTEPRKAGIARFSSHSLMVPHLEATEREAAIRELATLMQHEGFVDNAERLVEEALRREAIVSTAVDHGLAFPHVRSVEGGGLTLALGVSRKGIKFGSPKGKQTKLIFFLVIPTAASAFYLKLLSGLAQTFMEEEMREKLLVEDTPEKLWKALVKATRATIA